VFERFNPGARAVIVMSQEVARKQQSSLIDSGHLLLALTLSLGTDSSRALALLGVSEAEVRKRVERRAGGRRPSPSHIPFAPELKQVLVSAATWAKGYGDPDVTSDHLLLGLFRHPESAGARMLTELGVSLAMARKALADVAGSGQEPEELRDAAQAATSPYALARARGDTDQPRRRAAEASTRSTLRVDSPPDRAWSLLSSPHVWALSPRGCVMFEVAGLDQLWFLAGAVPGGIGDAQCLVFETSATPDRMELTLSARVREPLRFTLAVVPGRRGSSELRVTRTITAAPPRKPVSTPAMQRQLDEWLRAIGKVLEGRAPWPAGEIPPNVLSAWTSERRIEQPVSKSAAVLIDADQETVWNVLNRPSAPAIEGSPSAICSGYVPGARVGGVGEAHYLVFRQADGSHRGRVHVLIRYEELQLAVIQDIMPGYGQASYRLSVEAGKTRLELTQVWPGATLATSTGTSVARILEFPRKAVDAYKAHIESPS
jgi:hypothetical protein